MSLTRRLIREAAMNAGIENLPKEFEDAIIAAHVASVEGAVESATTKLNERIEQLQNGSGSDEFKTKYEAEKTAHDALKAKIAAEETNAKKRTALKSILDELKVDEKRHEAVLKVLTADIDKVELNADGTIKNADALKTSIATDWADFIVTVEKNGTENPNPVKTGSNKIAELQAQYDTAIKNKQMPQAMAILQEMKKEAQKE